MPGSPTSTTLPPSAVRWTGRATAAERFWGGLRVSFTQVRGKALWRGKVRQAASRRAQGFVNGCAVGLGRTPSGCADAKPNFDPICRAAVVECARWMRANGVCRDEQPTTRRVRLGWRGRRSQSVVTAKISAAIEACVGRRASFRWKCRRPGCKACPGYRDLPWLCHDAGAINPGQRRGHRATVTIGALRLLL